MTNIADEPRFPILIKLVVALMSIPHGNADVERVFSHVKLIKTDHRNRLADSTLNSLLTVRVNGMETQCFKYQPSSAELVKSAKACTLAKIATAATSTSAAAASTSAPAATASTSSPAATAPSSTPAAATSAPCTSDTITLSDSESEVVVKAKRMRKANSTLKDYFTAKEFVVE